jgi:hypothetical protein
MIVVGNYKSAKREKSVTFANQQKCNKVESLSPLHWYLHMELLWSYDREGVSKCHDSCDQLQNKILCTPMGMVDEKVTVISSFLTMLIFLLLKLGTH